MPSLTIEQLETIFVAVLSFICGIVTYVILDWSVRNSA